MSRHLVLNGSPLCRPQSGHFWGLQAVRTPQEFAACTDKCKACAKSKRWTFIEKKL